MYVNVCWVDAVTMHDLHCLTLTIHFRWRLISKLCILYVWIEMNYNCDIISFCLIVCHQSLVHLYLSVSRLQITFHFPRNAAGALALWRDWKVPGIVHHPSADDISVMQWAHAGGLLPTNLHPAWRSNSFSFELM